MKISGVIVAKSISLELHSEKSARIRSFSGPSSVQMRENTDQKKSEYGHFSRSAMRRIKARTHTNI